MQVHDTTSATKKSDIIDRWFPEPKLLSGESTGLDISDTSIKWVRFGHGERGLTVDSWGIEQLAEGVVREGVVHDAQALSQVIATVRKEHGITRVHASLPEEAGYVFAMDIPDLKDTKHVHNAIEFELEGRVPLRAENAIYDFDPIAPSAGGIEVGVTVFPRNVVEGYLEACQKGGVAVQSLEMESSSIGRAVIRPGSHTVSLIADFGWARTGFAVLRGQIPIFTSTVPVGGNKLTETVMRALNVSEDEANSFKDSIGLLSNQSHPEVHEAVLGTAAMLSDEILRHYRYWDDRRNGKGERVTPVTRVLLAGGGATMKGLPEYIASRVQAPTRRVNVWQNACSFDDYIPPLERQQSFGFATSIGLALRGI